MGKWAQRRHKGGGGYGEPNLPAPVLSFNDPDLDWVWTNPDPSYWIIQETDDGGSNWTDSATLGGGLRSWNLSHSGPTFRISGYGAGDERVTGYSNEVTPS